MNNSSRICEGCEDAPVWSDGHYCRRCREEIDARIEALNYEREKGGAWKVWVFVLGMGALWFALRTMGVK